MTESLLHRVMAVGSTADDDRVTANDIASLYARIHNLIETVKECPQQAAAGNRAKADKIIGNESF